MVEKKTVEAFELGTWVGRKQAFSAIAGRCSAADAECMRQAFVGKHYRALGLKWDEFCKQRLGLSRATADRIIARLEEFGPQYFVLAQATGITESEYRRIRPAVHGQALLHAGEEIPITPENGPRLAAAVEALKSGCEAREPGAAAALTDAAGNALTPAEAEIQAEIEREFARAAGSAKVALKQFRRLVERRLDSQRSRLNGELGYVIAKLRELEQLSWRP